MASVVPTESNETHRQTMAIQSAGGGKPIQDWDINQIGAWLNGIGMGGYMQCFVQHAIDGKALPQLSSEHLKEVGVVSVGHRLSLMSSIKKVQSVSRNEWRNHVIWEGPEYRPGPWGNSLPYGFPFCGESCTGRPAQYKLTNAKLNLTYEQKVVNMPGMACCGVTMKSDNIDLSNVSEADLIQTSAPCGEPPALISVHTPDSATQSMYILTTTITDGSTVQEMIMNAKVEADMHSMSMLMGGAPADENMER